MSVLLVPPETVGSEWNKENEKVPDNAIADGFLDVEHIHIQDNP